MELESAKYFKDPLPPPPNQMQIASFAEYLPQKSEQTESEAFPTICAIYTSLFFMMIGLLGSTAAICVLSDGLPARFRGGASSTVALVGKIMEDHLRTPDQQWMAYGISTGIFVLALIVIGCIPVTKSSMAACKKSPLALVVLVAGNQLRGTGPNAFLTGLGYMIGGTITAVAGFTWMITLHQEGAARGATSMLWMNWLAQLGTVALIGGAASLLRPNLR